MPYYLHLTLRQRATLSVGISIWNNQIIKDKIFKWLGNLQEVEFERAKGGKWQQLTKEVLKKVNQDVIPPQSRGELIHVIKALGEKILNWYIYIWYEYYNVYGEQGNIINYIDTIYWTPIGTVDEVKILQSFWMKNPELDVAVMYKIACKNALEEDIDNLWQKMPCSIKDCYDQFNTHGNYNSTYGDPHYDHLILAYGRYRTDGKIDHFTKYAVSNHLFRNEEGRIGYNQNYSIEHNMFLLSVDKGFSTAVKYFWKKLTQEEKDNIILYAAYVAVECSLRVSQLENLGDYIREKYVEILIFLINQMTMNQKESFLREESISDAVNNFNVMKDEILSMLLSIWPWQELFIPVLNNMLQYLENNQQPVLEALSIITGKMVEPSYAPENSKYRSMLHEAWLIIPGCMKQTMVDNDPDIHQYSNFMINLVKVGDMDSIKMIFNDPEIADVRMLYIKFGRMGYGLLIRMNKYESLNQFIEEVLQSEEEQKYLKSMIDHICLCIHFIHTGQYDLADKLLNWKFETLEEKIQCKDKFKSQKRFIRSFFKRLMCFLGSVDKAKEEFTRFLEWLLESEDEIASYKQEFMVISNPTVEKEVSGTSAVSSLSGEKVQNKDTF